MTYIERDTYMNQAYPGFQDESGRWNQDNKYTNNPKTWWYNIAGYKGKDIALLLSMDISLSSYFLLIFKRL